MAQRLTGTIIVIGSMAGLATNTLVAAGACMFAVLQISLGGTDSADRIIAQVVSGVGLLGAETVL